MIEEIGDITLESVGNRLRFTIAERQDSTMLTVHGVKALVEFLHAWLAVETPSLQTPDTAAALAFLETHEPPGTPLDEADFPRFGAQVPAACGLQLDGTCTKDDGTCAQTCPLHHLMAGW